jgi:hypothetical protein
MAAVVMAWLGLKVISLGSDLVRHWRNPGIHQAQRTSRLPHKQKELKYFLPPAMKIAAIFTTCHLPCPP